MPEPIIHVADLTKVYRNYDRREGLSGALLDLFNRRYRTLRAVDGVSFDIQPGEVVGYIGANGAGKSTTIKMLTGILAPTSGELLVNGLVPQRQRYAHARQIGVVFGQRTQLWWDLAVIEAFNLLQKIYRVPPELYRARLARFIEVLDIGGQLHQPVRKLSLGQRMKCDLAASLLHAPPILFLDEPTIGLDVAVKERVRTFIREINAEENSTIILTTHDLTDIEELCERLIILDAGKVLYDGSREEIYSRFGRHRRVVVEFRRDYSPEYATQPLPTEELPLEFEGGWNAAAGHLAAEAAALGSQAVLAGGQPLEQVGEDSASAPEPDRPPRREPTNDGVGAAVPASFANTADGHGGPPLPAQASPLDNPGARQFMAALSRLMDDGGALPVRKLTERRYQLSFDRAQYRASIVIGRLLEHYEVEDLELHEPELGDIVRAIYNRQG